MEYFNINIGEFIKKTRLKQNMTQEDLANKVYVTPQAVSKWERNESLPDILIFIRLSQIFQISVDELLSAGKGIQNLSFKELQNLEDLYSQRLDRIQDEIEKKRIVHKEDDFEELFHFDYEKNTKIINGYKVLIYDFNTFFDDYNNHDISYVLNPFLNRAMERMLYDVIFVSSISKTNNKKGTFILTLSDNMINLGFDAKQIMQEINPSPYPCGPGPTDHSKCSHVISHIVDRTNLVNIDKYFNDILNKVML